MERAIPRSVAPARLPPVRGPAAEAFLAADISGFADSFDARPPAMATSLWLRKVA
jgi:hypothetical protein